MRQGGGVDFVPPAKSLTDLIGLVLLLDAVDVSAGLEILLVN
jgi:hypothetical protein